MLISVRSVAGVSAATGLLAKAGAEKTRREKAAAQSALVRGQADDKFIVVSSWDLPWDMCKVPSADEVFTLIYFE
jgi:siroheme synthase